MSHVPQSLNQTQPSLKSGVALALPVAAGLLAILVSQQPIWALLALVAGVVIFAVAKWPEASTLTVVFILYSNAATVAVQFHGVPFIVGASFFLLLAIPLFYLVVVQRRGIIIQPALLLLVGFVLVQLLGAVSSRHPDIASKQIFTSLTEGVLLYFLVTNVVRTPATLRRVIWTLVAAGALMSLAPLYQQLTGQFNNQLGGFGQVSNTAFSVDPDAELGVVQPRLAGSVGEQNRFGQVMLMLFPLAMLRCWGESTSRLRTVAALATCLIAGAVILTFSRGAAVGFIAILLSMVAFRYIRTQYVPWVLVICAAVLIAVPQYRTRMASLQGLWGLVDSEAAAQAEPDGAIKSRLTEMGAAALAFVDHPLVGVGPGMFRFHYREYAELIGLRVFAKGRQSHSLLPGIAAEHGALGLFLFGAITLITLRDLLRARRRWGETHPDRANMAVSFVLVMVAYLTTAMFLHLGYVRYLWLMMALASTVSRLGENEIPSSSSVTQDES